jgi:hypothetical protein
MSALVVPRTPGTHGTLSTKARRTRAPLGTRGTLGTLGTLGTRSRSQQLPSVDSGRSKGGNRSGGQRGTAKETC